MTQVAIASSSRISAAAGERIVHEGGNAVDAALAAALVSAVSEPGVCALGAGAYLSIWPAGGDPVTIDANVAVPGLGLPESELGRGGQEIFMEYGGGITTIVGHGSVATPGALSGCDLAARRYGRLPWAALVQPAIDGARQGFPLSMASHNYLKFSHQLVFGRNEQSYAALHTRDGEILSPGSPVHVAGLAESLELIAKDGVAAFYEGDLAAAMTDDIRAHGGALTRRDLAKYRPIPRPCLRAQVADWQVATNPAPAVGGASLSAMLLLMNERPRDGWTAAEVAYLAEVQHRVLAYRRGYLDQLRDIGPAIDELIRLAEAGQLDAMTAPSTVHVSSVDDSGLACSITMSAGYGSGVMPPGTGIWLNNCLGEIELNRKGLAAGPPGRRLPSNMAPCVARSKRGDALAIGSPGADRITTAILQTLVNFITCGQSLEAAIRSPRLHVENDGQTWRAACEPGLAVDTVTLPLRTFEELSMYFGGVGAALRQADGHLVAAADPRRTGGTAIAGI